MANRPSVTFTAEMPSRRSPLDPSGLTSRNPGVSTTTVHVRPTGIEPRGPPFASSLTNTSPSPPRVTPGAPGASPLRKSGSGPGGAGCGRVQAAPPPATSRLTSPRLAQCRVQLCDGEVDIGIAVCAGDEAGLERRGGEEHATRERGPVPAREQRRVRGLRLREVANGAGGEVHPPQRARVSARDGDPPPARGVPYTRDQSRGSPLQRLLEPPPPRLPPRDEPPPPPPPPAPPYAPRATRPPRIFPRVVKSGRMCGRCCAPPAATRNPVITSSKISSAPWRSHSRRRVAWKSASGAMKPELPM